MRDPKRIKEASDLLKALWSAYPDLRLGQLVHNLGDRPYGQGADLFNVEDDVMVDRMKNALKNGF
jgi:uncharacterized protein YihD (DUF1040 family)